MDKFENLLCRFEKAVQRLETISAGQLTTSHRWKPGLSGNPASAYLSEQQKLEFMERHEFLMDIYKARKDLYTKGVLSEEFLSDGPSSRINRITNEAKLRVLTMFSDYSRKDIKEAMIAYSDAILIKGMIEKNIMDNFASKENGCFVIFEKYLALFKERYITDENTGLVADKEVIENKWYKRMFSI